MTTGETTAYTCEANAKGRSLKIQIKGQNKILTLCEVYVVGTGTVGVCIAKTHRFNVY